MLVYQMVFWSLILLRNQIVVVVWLSLSVYGEQQILKIVEAKPCETYFSTKHVWNLQAVVLVGLYPHIPPLLLFDLVMFLPINGLLQVITQI